MVSSRVLSVLITEEGYVKLASLFCVAALSFAGCADVETNGGGQGEGIHPSKIEAQNPNEPKPFDATQVVDLEQKIGVAPADAVCDGCVVTSYHVVDTTAGLDEVRIVSDGGFEVCRIYLKNDVIVVNECGFVQP
jgi:hypothetical protein